MKILIFDDNDHDIKQLQKNIESFFQTIHMIPEIQICPNVDYLFEHIAEFDILFLDIEIDNQNGIDIGMKLHQYKHNCRIIITTNFKKYSIDGYKINADRYFIKPIQQNEFNMEMSAVIDHYLSQFAGIFDPNISLSKILYEDIIFIEYYNRKTTLYLRNKTKIITPYCLKHWSKQLQKQAFSQPYKCYLVNFSHISDIKKDEIILNGQKSIPLSRHYRKTFLDQYLHYLSCHV